jgi:two-component system, chemotaxis family, sensor kinase CheA
MNENDDIVKEFLVESHENLDRLDRDLVSLEKHPSDREILGSIFRTIHTIKGTTGFLGFGKLEAVAHVGENLLTKLRDGQLSLHPGLTTALLAMVDAVRQMLSSIEASGSEGERSDQELIARLTRLLTAESTTTAPSAPPGKSSNKTAVGKKKTTKSDSRPCAAPAASSEAIVREVSDPAAPQIVELQSSDSVNTVAEPPEEVPGEASVESVAAEVKTPEAAEASPSQPAHVQSASDSTIRVGVGLLDQLMNLVGELVLARNQILQFTKNTEETGLVTAGQRLNLIASELQESVMKTRMQPIGSIWSRFPRTVRDVALTCHKQVRIQMEGQETELDKTLIEAIKDPMTHLVRNAVDHGIEGPDARRAAGKDPEGVLSLRAFHEGGQVNIEISDDGAGLNIQRVIQKAVQKGLISADQAARLSEREAANLVFLPGLSTAEKVTNVSGRGVGMDVVKTNIERIGGTVDLQSSLGKGTTVKVKIPLTLAIVPALIVTSVGQRYAIPQVSLLELVGLDGNQARKGVEMIHGVPVYRLRGRLLPLVHLKQVLKTGPEVDRTTADGVLGDVRSDARANPFERVNIVVLQADGRRFGLVVDEISDTEEIVVKPLGRHLKNISVYAGATIMGDGKVALILDVLGLAQSSSIVAEAHERARAEQEQTKAEETDRQKLVLFAGRAGSRMAVPLGMLARLENIPGPDVERSGNQWVTQYRGQILPLIRISHALQERRQMDRAEDILSLPTSLTLQVLVLENEGHSFGLVVNEILDIVESGSGPQSPATRPGVLYSSVIAEHVTELLDVPAILSAGESYEPIVSSTASSAASSMASNAATGAGS